jgi:hypothetical protein
VFCGGFATRKTIFWPRQTPPRKTGQQKITKETKKAMALAPAFAQYLS